MDLLVSEDWSKYFLFWLTVFFLQNLQQQYTTHVIIAKRIETITTIMIIPIKLLNWKIHGSEGYTGVVFYGGIVYTEFFFPGGIGGRHPFPATNWYPS